MLIIILCVLIVIITLLALAYKTGKAINDKNNGKNDININDDKRNKLRKISKSRGNLRLDKTKTVLRNEYNNYL